MAFSCQYCGYTTNKRSAYDRHLNRKTPCKKKKDEIIETKESFACAFCNQMFIKEAYLLRHQTRCNPVCLKNKIDYLQKENCELYNENEKLKNKIKELESTSINNYTNTKTVNNTTNNTVTNNITIFINSNGEEGVMEALDDLHEHLKALEQSSKGDGRVENYFYRYDHYLQL